jgi:catechol-2,3-dioxygenase
MAIPRKRLGELVIRSEQPDVLVAFYRNVIGLEPFATLGSATFLKIDDDFEGHPQLLAIFDKEHEYSGPLHMQVGRADAPSGTLHHFAFALDKADFDAEHARLQGMGIAVQTGEHRPFGWRSLYMHDPDGNSVELVCYDAALLDPVLNQRVRFGQG